MPPTTSDSDIIFESLEVKRNYALVLTNWVIENYNVENDETKRQIFEGFFALPDSELTEKGKMVEAFTDTQIIDMQQALQSARSLANRFDEQKARMETEEEAIFSF